jgi:hypothetical protein
MGRPVNQSKHSFRSGKPSRHNPRHGFYQLPPELVDGVFEHSASWELFQFLLVQGTHESAKRAFYSGALHIRPEDIDCKNMAELARKMDATEKRARERIHTLRISWKKPEGYKPDLSAFTPPGSP